MDKPQNASDAPAPSSVPLIVAVCAGLVAGMLMALTGLSAAEGVNWASTPAVAVATAVVAYVVAGRRRRTTTRRPGEH